MKVVVLTTSYPREPGDPAGNFVADAVERVRARGVDVNVVSPASFRHFGIAYGAGVVGNLRRQPWRVALLPAMLASFARAARQASRDADLVHAHWLPAGAVALTTGKPFVVQLWGTDVELARRAKPLARRVLRRARLVICASNALADSARALGAHEVRVIPSGVDVPDQVGDEAEPPLVLFAGRLSPEKGILELVEATDGMPSHREGFGVVCAEAMAYGRPVVAGAVGGLLDLVADGETGLLVPPRDVPALRGALEQLLGDAGLRRRMGEAARERVRAHFAWPAVTDATLAAYEEALA
jgi:glycosyltransferase involved in cell wall biosynthesis